MMKTEHQKAVIPSHQALFTNIPSQLKMQCGHSKWTGEMWSWRPPVKKMTLYLLEKARKEKGFTLRTTNERSGKFCNNPSLNKKTKMLRELKQAKVVLEPKMRPATTELQHHRTTTASSISRKEREHPTTP
eukprot:Em0001g3562a